jgi:hypothetical protein
MLGIQPRALDALLLEIGGRGVQDFEDGHHAEQR